MTTSISRSALASNTSSTVIIRTAIIWIVISYLEIEHKWKNDSTVNTRGATALGVIGTNTSNAQVTTTLQKTAVWVDLSHISHHIRLAWNTINHNKMETYHTLLATGVALHTHSVISPSGAVTPWTCQVAFALYNVMLHLNNEAGN